MEDFNTLYIETERETHQMTRRFGPLGKTERKLLEEAAKNGGSFSTQHGHYFGRPYGYREAKAACKLVQRGLVELVKSESEVENFVGRYRSVTSHLQIFKVKG